MAHISAGRRLRGVFDSCACVCVAGVYNGMSARLATECGHKILCLSGAALSASQGLPDIGVVPFPDFVRVIHEISNVTNVPLIADADTGFGDSQVASRVVFEFWKAGAAGLHVEDQKFPKRCGHLGGKSLVPMPAMATKIRAMAETARSIGVGDFLICARTDARGVEGFDAAVLRASAYVHAGAEMIFPEGLETLEEFAAFAKCMQSLPGPSPSGGPYILANMTEFGKTPHIHTHEFQRAGYHCVLFPVSSLRVAIKAMKSLYEDLEKEKTLEGKLPEMYTRQELYDTLRYNPNEPWHFPSPSIKK